VLHPVDTVTLLQLALFAVGVAYVVTGSAIGYPVRVVGWLALHRLPVRVHGVFFCPPCCAWWCGLGLALWAGLPWQNLIQVAFTSCLLGIIVQQQWETAANDEKEIEEIFGRKE
jgi:hypothetical protein